MSKDHKQRKRDIRGKRYMIELMLMQNNNTEKELKEKIGEDEYRRQQADYMKAYRAEQRQLKRM